MQPFVEVLLQLAAASVLAVGGYAIQRLAAWLKLREDSEVRIYLNQALERGIDLALSEARGRLPTYARLAPPELADAVDLAANYAKGRVPDALSRFRVDDVALRNMIAARLATRMAPPTAAPAA